MIILKIFIAIMVLGVFIGTIFDILNDARTNRPVKTHKWPWE